MLLQPAYLLDRDRRCIVLRSLRETCLHRGWTLLAAHVRTNHVHVVMEADRSAEQVLTTLKAYASRALNRAGLDGPERRRWARHGTPAIFGPSMPCPAAGCYVLSGQGEPMEFWENAG